MIVSPVYATEQGLGYLAKDFFDHDLIDKVMVVHHPNRENHYDWYPNRESSIEGLLEGATVLLGFETFFDSKLVDEAKKRGIKTVLIPMYECTTDGQIQMADEIINPSLLDQEYFPQGTYIPVPVDTQWKLRRRARVFVHNAGHGGLGGRNGTETLLKAIPHIQSDIKLIIRSQEGGIECDDPRVTIINKSVSRSILWELGDVFVFPEKFNGLSLPIQEAYASGMMVMATDRFPNNVYLPTDTLIPVAAVETERISRGFDCAVVDPIDLASTIDFWYDQDITSFSKQGKKWAETMSWNKLKPQYEKVLRLQ